MDEDNIIYIGNKEFNKYLVAATVVWKRDNSVSIQARGKFIVRAIDLAEVMKINNAILQEEVIIGSVQMLDRNQNANVNVSTININLTGE
jgi:DNA-binding protein Alba